jgi:23S rRNA pseudouridine955/2504/2580 synthase
MFFQKGAVMKEIIVGENDAGQRLDKFLTKAFPNLPQSALYKAIRKKDVKLGGKRAENGTILQYNDTIKLFLKDDFLMKNPARFYCAKSSPEDILDVLYEDEQILLINKKSGLAVHEDKTSTADNLAKRLQTYLVVRGEYDPEKEQSFAPALCNRLDRNTAGIVIAAKTAAALRVMNEKIKNREVDKYYLCVTVGVPKVREATLTAYHIKDSASNTVKILDRPAPPEFKNSDCKEIKTAYRVLRDNGELALLEVKLLTGRTHQIRAHLAHIGCPILGDGKYGVNRVNRAHNIKTQALCAYRLKFSFNPPAGVLDYLTGREFEVPDVWFRDKFV